MGSSSTQTVGYRYLLGMHIVATMGPVDLVSAIICDDTKVAWAGVSTGGSITVSAEGLYGGPTSEGGVSGTVDFLPGGPAQGTNDYLVGVLNDDLVPCFRGVASFVLRQCYLGMNPYLKNWAFKMQRVHVRQDGIAQWYDAKAAIPLVLAFGDASTGSDNWQYLTNAPSDTSNYSNPAFDDSSWGAGVMPFGNTLGISPPPGFSATPATEIDPDQSLWVRRHITLTTLPTSVALDSIIDDHVAIWFNGTLVLDVQTAVGSPTYPPHLVLTLPPTGLIVGDNVIAIKITNTSVPGSPGDYSWLDVHMTFQNDTLDMNPAHIIRECLTDPDWGMGYNEADMDDDAFAAAADTLYSELMGISLLWDTQTDIGDFITQILTHIDAVCYVDRTTGLFVLKLIRDDYDVDTILELTENDVDHIEDFKRTQFGELITSYTVQYWDSATNTQGSVTIQDIALEQMQQAAINTTVQYVGFTNSTTATIAAQRDLRSLSSQIASCTVYTDRVAKGLQIGSVFKLTWPDYELDSDVMRVTGMGYGDGKTNRIRITCIEDKFSLDTAPFIIKAPPIWADPSGPPVGVVNQIPFEYPYYALVRQTTQASVDNGLVTNPDAGYVGVALGRPTVGVINASMYSDAGSGYVNVSTADFCPTAKLTAGIADRLQTVVAIKNVDEETSIVAGGWCQIDNEICRVDAASPTSMTIARGCMDTIPALHSINTEVYFWSVGSGEDPTQYVSGESINVKVTPKTGSGVLDIANAFPMNVVMGSRANRPYLPGNLKFNGNYFPAQVDGDTVITWAHRDRTQETGGTLTSFTDATIGPETGVTYTIKVYNHAGTLVHTASGITANTYTYSNAQETTDGGPFGPDFTITLAAERGSYESFYKYSVTLSHPAPIVLAAVFIPLANATLQHPISMTYNNGSFLVGIAGTVGYDSAYGIYKIPAGSAVPTYFGMTDDGRFGAGTLASPKSYVPAHLTFVLPNNMNQGHSLQTASGIDGHFAFYWPRAGTDDPTNVKFLLVGDDSLGTLSSVVTDSSINDDIVGLVRKADASEYAICSGNLEGAPAKLYKSTTNGISWSYLGSITGLDSLEPSDALYSRLFEMDDHSMVYITAYSYTNSAGDGVTWVPNDIINSFGSSWSIRDAAYDGTALAVLARVIPPVTFDPLIVSDGPISHIDLIGSGVGGLPVYGDRADGTKIVRFSPGGIGITGAGWSPAPALAINAGAVSSDSLALGLPDQAISFTKLTYVEPRTSSNSSINLLQGTTDFTIEFWVGNFTDVSGPPTPGLSVLFSQGRGGNPQFQNVLLTFNSTGNVLRFRTIRQTGTSTYATDVDVSVSVGYNIYSAPDFLPRMVTVTRGTGGRVYIYINGTQVGTVASGPITDLTVTGATQTGCVWGNTSAGNNAIDGVSAPWGEMVLQSLCLYNKELSSAQIAAHYAAAQADGLTYNRIYKSTDRGVTWTKTRDVALNSDNWGGGTTRWDTIRKFGTGFAVFGQDAFSAAFPHVILSTDHGATWGSITTVVTSDGTNNARILQTVSSGSRIMATASTGSGGTLQLAYSDDAITFTDIPGTVFPPGSVGFNLITLDDTGEPRFAETGEVRITEN